MTREDLRRWVENYRAAEELQREELRHNPPTREKSIQTALELIAVAASLHGWPFPTTVVDEREDLEVAEAWMRLRAAFATPC